MNLVLTKGHLALLLKAIPVESGTVQAGHQPDAGKCQGKCSESADHEGMASELEAKIYFALPYSSWECGVNGNTIVHFKRLTIQVRDSGMATHLRVMVENGVSLTIKKLSRYLHGGLQSLGALCFAALSEKLFFASVKTNNNGGIS